ncbi:hypothetical protein HO173_008116 [Letharia columbiana]|uniref:Uncharacterized protein n=1 Tax=Letharia columbiana TaxID=112416 RepID=A0A8H6FRT2_9LECA|nr:uncharacterized protein HO173_008116 [Letharia columbiana]KAF6233559.1 hypothetical protein HO173_008116 [Letharia columbiana]
MSIPGAFENAEIPASPSLPLYQTDVSEMVECDDTGRLQDEGAVKREESSTPSRFQSRLGSGWLGKCYGSVKTLVGSNAKGGDRDVEAAVTGGNEPMTGSMLERTGMMREIAHRTQNNDAQSDVCEVESYHTAVDTDHQSPVRHGLASLAIGSDSCPRLLSDEENERMNRKIDRLIAAIDHRRPIHFAPDAETGEVEVFADQYGEVIDQAEYELEQNIAAASESFGRVIRFGDGTRRMRSPYSLRYADSTDSWASTDSRKSSSNAWERAIAAANIRFALGHGTLDLKATVIRQPFRSSEMQPEARRGRGLVRTISPIPLDFDKPLRTSTPSIHSNGSEQDTSSPLFEKSCERICRETYAEPPGPTFRREFPEHSQLDQWAFVSEPRDEPSREAKAPASTGRAFGVFADVSNGVSSSKKIGKPAIRSKALKDISNLRRLGHLKFNSFAKDSKLATDQPVTTVPATTSSFGFGGASSPESRRVYINTKWPGLLEDRGMAESPRLDGAARRRNEQAIGHPIDTSHYSLSHVRTSVADSSLNADPNRQAHFDLALARLEGRALPPPPSPIHRHPDSAALFDQDIQIEGTNRPLPLRGPMPSRIANSTPYRAFWRYFVGKEGRGH